MSVFFKPYEGKRPFVFISYSHRDSEKVLEIISALHAKKLRLWYDEGIPAGSDWPKNIEQHMRDAGAVLFFLSRTALASPNCYSEIKTAVALKKPLLVVPLEAVGPDETWKALLSHAGASAKPQSEEILQWKTLRRTYFRKWSDSFRKDWLGLFLAILLFAASLVGLKQVIKARPEPVPAQKESTAVTQETDASPASFTVPAAESVPVPTIDPGVFPVSFPDAQQERAVRAVLGKSEGNVLRPELAEITELYFCGNQVTRSLDGVTLSPDGRLSISGAEVLLPGKIADLSLIGRMVRLERLALIHQPLNDLAPLNGLVLLKELYLSDNEISDLSSLSDLPSLAVLHIEHTKIYDLTPLESLPSLHTVTVSADMLPLKWSGNKPFHVILIP